MLRKLENSWELVKASAQILKSDKELLVFPLISGLAVALVTATFFLPLLFFSNGFSVPEGGGPVAWVLCFLFYVAEYFVIFFFNSALVGAVMIRLEGGNPTVGDGFRVAFRHLSSILGYALIAATVGMVLRALSERSGFLGRLLVGLVGMAWNLATFLVVPILVTQNVGPLEAVRRSASILRKTWGEQVIGNTGLGFIFGLLYALWVVIAVPVGVLTVLSGQPLLIGTVVVLFALGFAFLALVHAALSGIYAAALYRYAESGQVGPFAATSLRTAFLPA